MVWIRSSLGGTTVAAVLTRVIRGGYMTRRTTASSKFPASARTNRRRIRRVAALLVTMFGLAFLQFGPGLIQQASAASPLTVYVGYMDTHAKASSSKQPSPWP